MPNLLDYDYSIAMYEYMKDNIVWEDGVKSRVHGFTRKAKAVDPTSSSIPGLMEMITFAISSYIQQTRGVGTTTFAIYGTYINYYRNGCDFTPVHNHPGTIQLVISLGASRTLNVGSKCVIMNSGDAVIFGVQKHDVPKDPNITEGRISIATFIRFN